MTDGQMITMKEKRGKQTGTSTRIPFSVIFQVSGEMIQEKLKTSGSSEFSELFCLLYAILGRFFYLIYTHNKHHLSLCKNLDKIGLKCFKVTFKII